MPDLEIGYEFFPSRSYGPDAGLVQTVVTLQGTNPWLVSVTSKGVDNQATNEAVEWLQQQRLAPVMPHVVCAGQSRSRLEELIHKYDDQGVRHILALAGDTPNDTTNTGELRYASELVDLVRSIGSFIIAVAVNAEPHPLSTDKQADRRNQVAKLRRADYGISQFFFEVESFDRLQSDLASFGNEKPIVPGLLLSTSLPAVERMSSAAGITIPKELHARLIRASEQDARLGERREMAKVVIEHMSELGGRLIEQGVRRLHLFTLNQPAVTRSIVTNLKQI